MINIGVNIIMRFNSMMSFICFILDFRFLPSKVQNWLFGTATRVLEVVSSLIMLGFSFTLFIGDHDFFTIDLYENFSKIHPHALAGFMLFVAILQLAASVYSSPRSNVISGFSMLLSAFVWFIVFGLFVAAYPPFSTGIFTYSILSLSCALAGRALITRNR